MILMRINMIAEIGKTPNFSKIKWRMRNGSKRGYFLRIKKVRAAILIISRVFRISAVLNLCVKLSIVVSKPNVAIEVFAGVWKTINASCKGSHHGSISWDAMSRITV